MMSRPISFPIAELSAPQYSHPDVLAGAIFNQLGTMLGRIERNLTGLVRADDAAVDLAPFRKAQARYRSLDPRAPDPSTMRQVVDLLKQLSDQGLSMGALRVPGSSGTYRELLDSLRWDLNNLVRLRPTR